MKYPILYYQNTSAKELIIRQPKLLKEFWADEENSEWFMVRKTLKRAKVLRSFLYDHFINPESLRWLYQNFQRTLREFFPIYDFDSSYLQESLPNLHTVSFNLYSASDWKSILRRTNIKSLNVLNMPCRVGPDDGYKPLSPEKFNRYCQRFAERLKLRRDLEKIHLSSSFDSRIKKFLQAVGEALPLFQEKIQDLSLTFTHERELRCQLDSSLQNVFHRATKLKLHTYEDTSFLRFLKENRGNLSHIKVLHLSFHGNLPNNNDLTPLQCIKELGSVTTFTLVLNDTSYQLLLALFENFSIPKNTESITLSFIFPSWTVFNHKLITSKPSFETFLKSWEGLDNLKKFDFEINDGALAEGFTNKLIDTIFPRLTVAESITIHCTESKGANYIIEEEKDEKEQVLCVNRLMTAVQHLLPTLENIEINIPVVSLKNLPMNINITDSKLHYLRLGNRCIGTEKFGDLINLLNQLETAKQRKNGFSRNHKKKNLELDVTELYVKNNKALTNFIKDLVQPKKVFGKILLNTQSIEKEHFVKNICSNMKNIKGKTQFNLKFLTCNMRHEDLEMIGRTLETSRQFCPIEIESIDGIKMLFVPGKGYKISSLKSEESSTESSLNWIEDDADSVL